MAFHSEVIGSLLRPEPLKEAMRAAERGEGDPAELERLQDEAGRAGIALQEEAGIDVITDGEVRRMRWFDPLTAGLEGFSLSAPAVVQFHKSGDDSPRELPAVRGKVSLKENLPLRETRFVAQHATRAAVKATLPGMTYASVLYVPGVSEQAYPDREEFLRDVLDAYREIVQQLVDAGVTYVQLDSPRYTHMVSDEGQENLRKLGLEPAEWLAHMIDLDNELIDSFPDLTWGLHLCRGNSRSMWAVEGGYDAIAEQLFSGIHVDRLLLEYDSPRAGTFAPLRFVPADKTVVLGLITTKEPELESADLLKRRLEEASEHVAIERLALSPQCGFASSLPGNLVTEEIQRAKLQRLGEVAREVWPG
jgi:5-methyltetrahydropteroyltriglutamate--homocysteine methyltransferase